MAALDTFSQIEFNDRLAETTRSILINPDLSPVERPCAYLLGGQSGAGKTTLHVICKKKLRNNVVVINGDEYRRSHPRFALIQDRYGIDAPAYTAAWSGNMVEALIDSFSRQGYNLIIEGTLRTSEVPLKTARLLRERGYDVKLSIMAVKPEISLVSCQIRYEQMRIAGTTPRAVDPAHHKTIVDEIAGNLATLERSDLFSEVGLYNRAGECLFAGKLPNGDAPASAVLQDVLFGPWTGEEERHYTTLMGQLAELRSKQ